jgi:hypothetical protein
MKTNSALVLLLIISTHMSAYAKTQAVNGREPVKVESFEYVKQLDIELLSDSLRLGRRYFLQSLNPRGDFYTIYDFDKKEHRVLDMPRIQAAAFWKLARINRYTPSVEMTDACLRSI